MIWLDIRRDIPIKRLEKVCVKISSPYDLLNCSLHRAVCRREGSESDTAQSLELCRPPSRNARLCRIRQKGTDPLPKKREGLARCWRHQGLWLHDAEPAVLLVS